MEALLLEILDELKKAGSLDEKALAKIVHRHNKLLDAGTRHHSKKRLLPYYLKVRESDPDRWAGWGIDPDTEKLLLRTLQVKPRRTASGVATITVITKPWKCSSDCIYCPNDVRMPKSYLSDEPACQRAERNFFDPYLQVTSRLRALTHMGHPTDKVELIVLGGTWSDYPAAYQLWFITELFRALNDSDAREENAKARRKAYKGRGLSNREEDLENNVGFVQRRVEEGALSYNQAVAQLYGEGSAWQEAASFQVGGFDDLARQHAANEGARHRVVGLVIETRPDMITCESLTMLRRLGCTKVQMGIQSLDPAILAKNDRRITVQKIEEAFDLLRIFGFKIHAHFMVNLFGATPAGDIEDYRRFVTEKAFLPDEVKLYPCSLVNGTKLCALHGEGSWKPYSEEELLEVLAADTLITPPFIRVSRMIRDISAHDIVAGNKKTNLRQLVERKIEAQGGLIREMRYREISTDEPDIESLELKTIYYETTATEELFLQWVTPKNRIAGFLRLSLPKAAFLEGRCADLPIEPSEAMIREVHVYGKAAKLKGTSEGAQHLGLGRQLIDTACAVAEERGYARINVISSVGTREYYRSLGFSDNGLYQQKALSRIRAES